MIWSVPLPFSSLLLFVLYSFLFFIISLENNDTDLYSEKIFDGAIKLIDKDVDNEIGSGRPDSFRQGLPHGFYTLQPVAYGSETQTHHDDGKADVGQDAAAETACLYPTHHIEQDGMGNDGEQQDDGDEQNQLYQYQSQGIAMAIDGAVEMQQAAGLKRSPGNADEQ